MRNDTELLSAPVALPPESESHLADTEALPYDGNTPVKQEVVQQLPELSLEQVGVVYGAMRELKVSEIQANRVLRKLARHTIQSTDEFKNLRQHLDLETRQSVIQFYQDVKPPKTRVGKALTSFLLSAGH